MNQPCHYTTTGGTPVCPSCQNQNGAQAPCPPEPPCPPPCPPPYPPYPPPMPPVPPRPDRIPPAQEANVSCGCACAPGLVAALQLLCDPRFAPLTDYKQFAFITDHFVLGSSLNCPATAATPYDNLTGPLDGEFVAITPDSCKNLEVSGQLYYPIPICTGQTETPCCADGPYFNTDEVALCSLVAVAFGVSPYPTETGLQDAYDQLKRQFWQATHAGCGPMPTTPIKPTPCDHSEGTLAGRSTISITVGPLIIGNARVLGALGDVLILANDSDHLFYYVCQSAAGFIG